MVVTWSTMNKTESVVEYGIKGLVLRAVGRATEFMDGGAFSATQYIHRVTLIGLVPGIQYSR